MKKLLTQMASLCIALVLLASSSVMMAFAEEGGLSVNGEDQVDVGETMTYTLYLSEATEPIVGFQIYIFYDDEYLEYQKDSLTFEKFSVVFYNEDIPGKIPMNCSQIMDMPVFAQKTQFVSADFKVLKPGKANIKYYVTDLYGEDMTYLKSYTFTYSLKVGDKTIVDDKTPPLDTRKEIQESYGGDFINYGDGMGEVNSPKEEAHREMVEENGSLVPYIRSAVQSYTEVVPGTAKEKSWFAKNRLVIIIVLALLLGAVVASVVFVVLGRNKSDMSKSAKKSDTGKGPDI